MAGADNKVNWEQIEVRNWDFPLPNIPFITSDQRLTVGTIDIDFLSRVDKEKILPNLNSPKIIVNLKNKSTLHFQKEMKEFPIWSNKRTQEKEDEKH